MDVCGCCGMSYEARRCAVVFTVRVRVEATHENIEKYEMAEL